MRVRFGRHQQLPRLSGVSEQRGTRLSGRAVTRRAAVGLVVGAAAAPYLICTARAADPLSLRLDWSPHAMHCSFHLASERGWFKKAGLDVKIEDGNGSTTTVQLVGAGNFDVGHAALAPMAIAHAAGLRRPTVEDWIAVNRAVPRLVDALPNGPVGHVTVRVFLAGGVPEVMLHLRELGLLREGALTVTGEPWGKVLDWWKRSSRR